jgi:hypothetical protein
MNKRQLAAIAMKRRGTYNYFWGSGKGTRTINVPEQRSFLPTAMPDLSRIPSAGMSLARSGAGIGGRGLVMASQAGLNIADRSLPIIKKGGAATYGVARGFAYKSPEDIARDSERKQFQQDADLIARGRLAKGFKADAEESAIGRGNLLAHIKQIEKQMGRSAMPHTRVSYTMGGKTHYRDLYSVSAADRLHEDLVSKGATGFASSTGVVPKVWWGKRKYKEKRSALSDTLKSLLPSLPGSKVW